MSLLKSLTDAVLQGAGQKAGLANIALQNPALMQGVMGLLSSDGAKGGLPGLLDGFQKAGLGDVVESWLGQGPNKPIAPAQVQEALGPDVVAQLAAKAQLAPSETSDLLARALPAMIDMLTPQGQAQQMDLSSVQSLLGGFLKGKV